MNKFLLPAGIVGLIIIVAVSSSLVNNKADQTANNSSNKPAATGKFAAVDACKQFTLAEAKEIMGPAATGKNDTAPTSSEQVNVSSCGYSNGASDVKAIRSAAVLYRSALNQDGADSNKQGFESQKPTNAQAVTGYGEQAYYSPDLGQLNIYDNNAWIITSYGDPIKFNENTLADAKLIADKVLN